MSKLDRTKGYATIYGRMGSGIKFRQGEKYFNGRGIEVDEHGRVVDPNDLIIDKPKEEIPAPINNKKPEFQREWEAGKDPPNKYIGLTHEGFKNPDPIIDGVKCDVCGFEAKSQFGLNAHKRYKHKK